MGRCLYLALLLASVVHSSMLLCATDCPQKTHTDHSGKKWLPLPQYLCVCVCFIAYKAPQIHRSLRIIFLIFALKWEVQYQDILWHWWAMKNLSVGCMIAGSTALSWGVHRVNVDCHQSRHSVMVSFVGWSVTCVESPSVCSRLTSRCSCDICVNRSLTVSTSLLMEFRARDCHANTCSHVLESLRWFAKRCLMFFYFCTM